MCIFKKKRSSGDEAWFAATMNLHDLRKIPKPIRKPFCYCFECLLKIKASIPYQQILFEMYFDNVSAFAVPDLIAVLDTADHQILMQSLKKIVGLSRLV